MISVTDLKSYLNVAGSTYDTLLTTLEEMAVEWFQAQTDRYFGPIVDVTEIRQGTGTKTLWLKDTPRPGSVSSVFEVTAVGEVPTAVLSTATDGWEFRIQDDEGKLVRKNGAVWVKGYEYPVDYDRGYPAGEEPKDVRLAITRIVAILFRQASTGTQDMKSETIDNYSYTKADFDAVVDTDPFIMRTILRWRRPKI